jgi:putative hemolysin
MEPLPGNKHEKPAGLFIPEGTIIAEALLHFFKYKKLSKVYSETNEKDPVTLINYLLDELDLKFEIPEQDLNNIPSEGGFITVSNHPYRGIDSMLLYKLISEKRKDFKVIASYFLQNIELLKNIILPVNPFGTEKNRKSQYSRIKEAINYVKNDHCLGIFPAGESPNNYEISKVILDNEWQPSGLKFIKNLNVPVVPVYFHGTSSRLVDIFRQINPLMKLVPLPDEMRNKKNRIVKVRIGSPITVREQNEFKDIALFGRFLRSRTYLLGTTLEAKKFFTLNPVRKKSNAEPIEDQVPTEILLKEFNRIRPDYELFSTKNYSVICAPTWIIPKIFHEIGRLRELTFREVGEGTNKSIDIDNYDLYYFHLFIWDTDENRIVGAYRIGKGKDIVNIYSIKGFYISSLFKIKKEFIPVLKESLELGRSFIVKDYQKKAMPLFLLWKGIMFFLLVNPEYRYLIGPVSISNDFSKFSRTLIVEFIKASFFDEEKARLITPRTKFVVKHDKAVDNKIFLDLASHDINKIEKIIMGIEPGYRMPVLFRRYMEINARIVGFNVDPKFNNCLDGLMILDVYSAPPDLVKGLSRELNDGSILERFRLSPDNKGSQVSGY